MYKLTFHLYEYDDKVIKSNKSIKYDLIFEKTSNENYKDLKQNLQITYTIVDDELIKDFLKKYFYPFFKDKCERLYSNSWYEQKIENIFGSKIQSHYMKEKLFLQLFIFLKQQKINEIFYNRSYAKTFLKTKSLTHNPIYLILGATGSGKNTLANYLVDKYDYYHFEASDFMHYEYYKKNNSFDDDLDTFSLKILKNNPTVVSQEIVKLKHKLKDIPLVISGFRSEKEIEYLQRHIREKINILYISTQRENRFLRCIQRNRADVAYSWDDFIKKDILQYKMGIKNIERLCSNVVDNNDDLDQFYKNCSKYFTDISASHTYKKNIVFRKIHALNREQICILALNQYKDKYLSSYEIVSAINTKLIKLSNKDEKKLYKYLENRILPFYKIKLKDNNKLYKINSSGKSYAKYILAYLEK